ncbi:hec ndc80p family protein, partial [Cystoisospora suis]
MQAPNSGHQWPLHLHALCWLCELLIYESEVFNRDPNLNPSLQSSHTLLSSPLSSSSSSAAAANGRADSLAGGVSGEEKISRLLLNYYAQTGHGRDTNQIQHTICKSNLFFFSSFSSSSSSLLLLLFFFSSFSSS